MSSGHDFAKTWEPATFPKIPRGPDSTPALKHIFGQWMVKTSGLNPKIAQSIRILDPGVSPTFPGPSSTQVDRHGLS